METEDLMMFDLTGHYYVSDTLAFEVSNQTSQLTDAHPFEFAGMLRYFGSSFFFDCGNNNFNPAITRAREHQERKATVTGDQSVSHNPRDAFPSSDLNSIGW
jgi:hypothetical protein